MDAHRQQEGGGGGGMGEREETLVLYCLLFKSNDKAVELLSTMFPGSNNPHHVLQKRSYATAWSSCNYGGLVG